jgi:hypothetical protein
MEAGLVVDGGCKAGPVGVPKPCAACGVAAELGDEGEAIKYGEA